MYPFRSGSYINYDISTNTQFLSDFKPYWLVDASLYYNIKTFVIFITASNLLDTKYTDIGSLVQPGRWINGGIRFDFPLGDVHN